MKTASSRIWVVTLAVLIGVGATACTPSTVPSALLDITTNQVVCGGVYRVPPCTTSPASRAIDVSQKGSVVASGTSGTDGTLVLSVPVGDLVVSVPGAQPYMNCDTPSVTSAVGKTIPVTQTCTLDAP